MKRRKDEGADAEEDELFRALEGLEEEPQDVTEVALLEHEGERGDEARWRG